MDAYRILRVPAESGRWDFKVETKDVVERGESYRVTITARNEGHYRLMPLSDSSRIGQPVEISMAGCKNEAEATLFVDGEGAQTVPFLQKKGGICTATVQAPDKPGLFPVGIEASGMEQLWTTITVGQRDQVIDTRDDWRPEKQPWDDSGWSTMAVVGLVALTFVGGLLLLAALGAVGFLVYQRSIANKEDSEDDTDEVTDEDEDEGEDDPEGGPEGDPEGEDDHEAPEEAHLDLTTTKTDLSDAYTEDPEEGAPKFVLE